MTEPVFKTADMPPEEVIGMCQGIYLSFLTPRFVLGRLWNTRSWNDVKYLMRGAKAVLGHLKDFDNKRRQDLLKN